MNKPFFITEKYGCILKMKRGWCYLKIVVNENKRIVEFWLTNEEKNNKELKNTIVSDCKEWKKKKFFPVIFESGNGDLKDSIEGLLRHNCETMAQNEIAMNKCS